MQLVFLVIISQHRSPTVWLFSFSISFSTVVEHSNDLILDNSTISVTSCQDILIFLCFQVCRFYQITAHQYWYTVPAHAASFGAKLITLFLIFYFVFFVFSFNHFTWSYLPLEWWQKQTPEELLSITPELNIVPSSIEHLETHSTGLNGVLSMFGAVFLFLMHLEMKQSTNELFLVSVRMTGHEFFTRFPALYPFLLNQLEEAAASVERWVYVEHAHAHRYLCVLTGKRELLEQSDTNFLQIEFSCRSFAQLTACSKHKTLWPNKVNVLLRFCLVQKSWVCSGSSALSFSVPRLPC